MRFYRIWVIALGCVTGVSAQHVWNVGSFYIPNVSDEVELQEIRVGAQAESTYLSGALRLSGTSREDVFLLGSNGMACFYSMPGELTVERFEQLGPVTEKGLQQSRLIFNMTEGIFTVNSSALSESSQFIVETPLGRVTAGAGLWTLSVIYDARTRIYNFTLESIDLELTCRTHSGEHFVVQAGQMLSGAGASTLPDLEVADLLNSAQDRIVELEELMEGALATLSKDDLSAKLVPIVDRVSVDVDGSTLVNLNDGAEDGRPIVIEYSPRPKPLVPFRGVVRPPSEYQKDLF